MKQMRYFETLLSPAANGRLAGSHPNLRELIKRYGRENVENMFAEVGRRAQNAKRGQ